MPRSRTPAPPPPAILPMAAPSSPVAPSARKTAIALMQRDEGATVDDLAAACAWQPHSARAFVCRLAQQGSTVTRSRRGKRTCYHLAEAG